MSFLRFDVTGCADLCIGVLCFKFDDFVFSMLGVLLGSDLGVFRLSECGSCKKFSLRELHFGRSKIYRKTCFDIF